MRRIALLLPALFTLAACSAVAPSAHRSSLYVVGLNPPALVELDSVFRPLRDMPLTIPDGCALQDAYAPSRGSQVALELNCPFGQAVVTVNTADGSIQQPVKDSDSHFLAWTTDGSGLYLKINSVVRPAIILADVRGARKELPIDGLTYDLAPRPGQSSDFAYALSRGMGFGSELWLAHRETGSPEELAADPVSYLSLARWSPDGTRLAFIQIPDSPTPYSVGKLWVMQPGGNEVRKLADVDAGHGFAPSWSSDGKQIAFVHRNNPDDKGADESADALVSDIHAMILADGSEIALTALNGARVGAPAWQPDGDHIAFIAVLDDKMNAYVLDVNTRTLLMIAVEPACCVVWVQK